MKTEFRRKKTDSIDFNFQEIKPTMKEVVKSFTPIDYVVFILTIVAFLFLAASVYLINTNKF